jgi:hypothetical protein
MCGSGLDLHLIFLTAYKYRLKNPKVLRSPDSQEKWRESVDILSKTDVTKCSKAAE